MDGVYTAVPGGTARGTTVVDVLSTRSGLKRRFEGPRHDAGSDERQQVHVALDARLVHEVEGAEVEAAQGDVGSLAGER